MTERSEEERGGPSQTPRGGLDSRHKSRLVYSVRHRSGQTIHLPGVRVQLPAGKEEKRIAKPVLKIRKALKQMGTKVEIKGVETPGLLIREMKASDARSFARYMMRDDYQAKIAVRYESAADIQKFVARCLRRQAALTRSVFHLSAELKASGQVMGDGFLIMNRPKTFEIGWGVHPDLWGRGFGVEIGGALLAIAFERLGAETVWAKSFVSNEASLKIMKKLGMPEQKVAENHQVAPGFRTDVAFHSISAADYFDAPY